MQRRNRVQIIIPCLNEESSIPTFIEELEKFRQSDEVETVSFEILFVDNGSTDQSFQLLESHCSCNPLDSLIRCSAPGYGTALKMGFENSSAELLGFTDLDCTYPFNKFSDLYKCLMDDQSLDIVIANRMTKHSKMPLLRTLGNKLYTGLIRAVYQVQLPDACSGMRLFRRRVLSKVITCNNPGLGFSIELTCRMIVDSCRYHFVNINYNERKGASKLNLIADGFSFLNQIFYSKRIPYDKT